MSEVQLKSDLDNALPHGNSPFGCQFDVISPSQKHPMPSSMPSSMASIPGPDQLQLCHQCLQQGSAMATGPWSLVAAQGKAPGEPVEPGGGCGGILGATLIYGHLNGDRCDKIRLTSSLETGWRWLEMAGCFFQTTQGVCLGAIWVMSGHERKKSRHYPGVGFYEGRRAETPYISLYI